MMDDTFGANMHTLCALLDDHDGCVVALCDGLDCLFKLVSTGQAERLTTIANYGETVSC